MAEVVVLPRLLLLRLLAVLFAGSFESSRNRNSDCKKVVAVATNIARPTIVTPGDCTRGLRNWVKCHQVSLSNSRNSKPLWKSCCSCFCIFCDPPVRTIIRELSTIRATKVAPSAHHNTKNFTGSILVSENFRKLVQVIVNQAWGNYQEQEKFLPSFFALGFKFSNYHFLSRE